MKIAILTSIIISPLLSLAQTEDCNMKDIERLGDKIKNPVPRSENYTIEYQYTTRQRAAHDLMMNFTPCLKGLEMSYVEQLLGKGHLRESKDPLDLSYQLQYGLGEFDENKKLVRFGIIAY